MLALEARLLCLPIFVFTRFAVGLAKGASWCNSGVGGVGVASAASDNTLLGATATWALQLQALSYLTLASVDEELGCKCQWIRVGLPAPRRHYLY